MSEFCRNIGLQMPRHGLLGLRGLFAFASEISATHRAAARGSYIGGSRAQYPAGIFGVRTDSTAASIFEYSAARLLRARSHPAYSVV